MTAVQERPAQPDAAPSSNPEDRWRHVRRAMRWLRNFFAGRGKPSRLTKAPTAATIITTWTLLACSFAALWFVFFALVLSSLQFQHSQSNLYAKFREQLSLQVAPLGGIITPDAPVALMTMPSMHIKDSVVLEGTASGDLAMGAGHRRDTPLPGQAGTSVIFGRETLFSGIFGDLPSAKPGATFTMTTGQGAFTYKVEEVRHKGDKFPTLLKSDESRITFVTAEGGSWKNGWTPQRTVYIDAKLQGKVVGTPSGRLTAIPSAEQAMKGDVSALFSLVLWLPLLIFGAVAAVWAQDRWGRWQTWLIGVPVIVAGLWGVTETAIQLLPNLM
ncbi:sortase [Jatrophihabitans sp. DSM 45814]